MTNNERFRRLIKRHKLTRAQAAALAMVHKSTVDRWLVPETTPHNGDSPVPSTTFRRLIDSRLQLFRFNLTIDLERKAELRAKRRI